MKWGVFNKVGIEDEQCSYMQRDAGYHDPYSSISPTGEKDFPLLSLLFLVKMQLF